MHSEFMYDLPFNSKVLDLLARTIQEEFTDVQIKRILSLIEIPDLDSRLRWTFEQSIQEVLKMFDGTKGGRRVVTLILEEFMDPLSHDANEVKAKLFVEKIRNILTYEGLHVVRTDGKYVVLDSISYDSFVEEGQWEDWIETEDYIKTQRDLQLHDLNKEKIDVEKVVQVVSNNVNQIVSNGIPHTSETKIKNGKGYLVLDGAEIEVGPSKNIPFRFLNALYPFGKAVAITALYENTSNEDSRLTDKSYSVEEKKEKLKNRIKDLQQLLPSKKLRVRLGFNDNEGTVYMIASVRG
jgi:hypothetical protein